MFYVQSVEHILEYTLNLDLYLRYCIRYLYFVLYMYFCDSNCICYLYLHYLIHRLNCILYMYFCDIICICFYVQSVEHFVGYRTLNKYYYYY